MKTSSSRGVSTSLLGRRLFETAFVLFVIYGATVIGFALPLRPFDAVWQLAVAGALINNAPLALVGLALMHLSVRLEPGESLQLRRLAHCAHAAQFAAVGFLCLVPLQLMAVRQTLLSHQTVQNRQMTIAERRIEEVRRAITASTTVPELQRELARLKVGTLTIRGNPSDSSLSGVREQLLTSLESSRSDLQSRLNRTGRGKIWDFLQLSLQGVVSSLALAFGFAALAQGKGRHRSQLDAFRWSMGRLLPLRRSGRRRRHGHSIRAESTRNQP
ncbi:MAG: hypothetical protein QUV07_10080 [Cyanobium sp. CZS 25K]|nr:hypothetical protein [Cyanobium sp. CZS25K]